MPFYIYLSFSTLSQAYGKVSDSRIILLRIRTTGTCRLRLGLTLVHIIHAVSQIALALVDRFEHVAADGVLTHCIDVNPNRKYHIGSASNIRRSSLVLM